MQPLGLKKMTHLAKLNVHNILFIFACILIASLPLSEGIKNISLVLLLLFSIIILKTTSIRKIRSSWQPLDSIFFLILLSATVSTLFATPQFDFWDNLRDIIRIVFLGILLSHLELSTNQTKILLGLILTSTSASLLYGLSLEGLLELKSVGHVNHSAIYIAISCGIAVAVSIAKNVTLPIRLLGLVATILFAYGLLISSARGSVLPFFLVLLPALGILSWSYSKKIVGLLMVVILAASASAIFNKMPILDKTLGIFDNSIGQRDKAMRTGLLIWKSAPIIGVGPENVKRYMTEEKLEQLALEQKGEYKANDYLHGHLHTHNLYTNKLAGLGIIGLFALISLLSYWAVEIFKHKPRIETAPLEFILWSGSLSAWVLISVGGLFNTTFHHEVALLSVSLLTLWSNYIRNQPERLIAK